MTLRRYARAPIIKGGQQLGTSTAAVVIKRAVDDGTLDVTIKTLQGVDRLDIIAGRLWGDSQLWWIIAAASGIGWPLQVPPGTRLVIPSDLAQVAELVG